LCRYAEAVTQTVPCPARCVGAVIGPGGVVIKAIQKHTGARVVVMGSRGRGSDNRTDNPQGAVDVRGLLAEGAPRIVSISGRAVHVD
jgi:polyribonucleotide nucleotidyltransferase